MAQADTLGYWNALAAVRGALPVAPAVAASVRTCHAGDLSGDAQYTYRCPGAVLEYASTPTAATAELVFPRSYFAWVKSYLSQALRQRPSSTASAELRVVWALDVWAHTQYALFALPFPWSDIYGGGIGGLPEIELAGVVFGNGPRSLVGAHAEAQAWSAEKARIASSSSTATIREAAAASRLCPSPFSELAVQWCAAPGSRSPLFQRPNPIWPLLLQAVQPWSSNWANQWIASRGNKDNGDLARWKNEPVLTRAVLQWRLWSAQDWGYVGNDPTFWPDGMGRADAVSTLGAYMAHVAGEKTAPAITFRGRNAYPNLAFGIDAVASFAHKVAAMDFDTLLQLHLDMWLQRSGPRLDAAGNMNLAVRQPVTRTDYADYFRGLRKSITDRMRLALQNPALLCAPNDAQCLKGAEFSAKVNTGIQSSPLAPIQNNMQRLADKLVELLGAAVGGGYEPFFVLRDPFSRTFAANGFRLTADGSSADVFFRINLAIQNYKQLLPGLFSAQLPQAARVQRGNCKVHWTTSDAACEICEGQPRPACAANVPGLAPQAVAQMLPRCQADFTAYLAANPAVRDCLMGAGLDAFALSGAFYLDLCAAVTRGDLNAGQMDGYWQVHLRERGCVLPKPNLFAVLAAGFIRASNPLR